MTLWQNIMRSGIAGLLILGVSCLGGLLWLVCDAVLDILDHNRRTRIDRALEAKAERFYRDHHLPNHTRVVRQQYVINGQDVRR